MRHLMLRFEVRFWREINKLEQHVHMHFFQKTDPSPKALFVFSYKDCVGSFDKRRRLIESFPFALVHLSHYMIRTAEKAKNLSKLSNVMLVGDSDISSNSYFREYFAWYKRKIFILPFQVAPRFQPLTAFEQRDRRCVAVGSFHDLTQEIPSKYYQDFIRHFASDTYHPIRKMLYANDKNQDWLTCHVSPYRGNTSCSRSGLRHLIKYFSVRQKSYFSINMVDEFNNHQFAVVGEELSGFPALGAFEAMGCGCILLASSEQYYQGLNLQVGTHYLLHDGTVAGMKKIMEDLMANRGRAQHISEEGRCFVNRFMRGEFAYESLMNVLRANQ